MINKLENLLGFNQKALGLRAARQELLSGNIANADTPGFKARDFDFAKAMQNVQSPQRVQHSSLATTAPGYGRFQVDHLRTKAVPCAAATQYRW